MNVIVGVDYGRRRLGVAVSDETWCMAMPRGTITVSSVREALSAVKRLSEETQAAKLIVGIPLNMDGTKGAIAQEVDAFVEALRPLVAMPVETWDERFTSSIAEQVLLEADLSRRKRKGVIDKLAAQIMLQDYLEAQAARKGRSRTD